MHTPWFTRATFRLHHSQSWSIALFFCSHPGPLQIHPALSSRNTEGIMRNATIACFVAAAISILAAPVLLLGQPPPQKTEPWKSEDVIYAEYAQPQTRISPDAKWLVWVKSTGDKEKDARVSNLIL